MSKTSQNRSKTLLVLSWLSRVLSWSILRGFWVRIGRDLEAWGCVTNQALRHKNDCRGGLRPQDCQIPFWTLLGGQVVPFWIDFAWILGASWEDFWTPQARHGGGTRVHAHWIIVHKKMLEHGGINGGSTPPLYDLFKRAIWSILKEEWVVFFLGQSLCDFFPSRGGGREGGRWAAVRPTDQHPGRQHNNPQKNHPLHFSSNTFMKWGYMPATNYEDHHSKLLHEIWLMVPWTASFINFLDKVCKDQKTWWNKANRK